MTKFLNRPLSKLEMLDLSEFLTLLLSRVSYRAFSEERLKEESYGSLTDKANPLDTYLLKS